MLVYRTAVFNNDRTGTRYISPSIELCSTINSDTTVITHFNKAHGTHGKTCIRSASELRSGKVDNAVNGYMSATCHSKSTVRGRLSIRVQIWRSSIYRIIRVLGNQKRHACGNSIVSCRKCAVSSNNNGLIRDVSYCSHCRIQPLIKSVAIYQKPSIRIRSSKYGCYRHVRGRLQRTTFFIGNDAVISCVNPSNERCSTCRSCYNSCTFFGYLYAITVSNLIAAYSNTAQSTVIIKSYVRFRLCGNDRKILHYKLIHSTIFCCSNGDGNATTRIQHLAE